MHAEWVVPDEPPEWQDPLAQLAVLGLAVPELGGSRLLRSLANQRAQAITLAFGDETSASGPFVSVTSLSLPRLPAVAPAAAARDALAAERDRLFARAGIDEPDPTDAQTMSGQLRIEGEFVTARVRREGALWVAQARIPADLLPPGPGAAMRRRLVTVISRGVPLPSVELTLVADLRPFWAARDAWLRSRRADTTPDEEPVEADGMSTLEGLVHSAVPGRQPGQARQQGPRRPVDVLRREWVAALQTQMYYARQTREEANRALVALVSQLRELSQRVQWWDEASEDVIAESIRFTVFDSAVASVRAQELWGRAMDDPSQQGAWLAEWEQWRGGRGRSR
jgi:hypothetical protein